MLPVAAKVALSAVALVGGYYGVKKYVAPKARVMLHPTTKEPLLQSMSVPHPVLGKVTVAVPVTAPSPLPAPSPIIVTSQGSAYVQGDDVKTAQGQLNVLGFGPLKVDGVLGPLSKAALQKFQAANGLVPDGALGDVTRAKLTTMMQTSVSPAASTAQHPAVVAANPANAALTQTAPGEYVMSPIVVTGGGDTGKPAATAAPPPTVVVSTVKDVQHALNVLGASPALVEDGIAGPKTTAATKAFQTAHGLTSDGIAGPITKAALAVALSAATVAAGEDAFVGAEAHGDFYSKGADLHG